MYKTRFTMDVRGGKPFEGWTNGDNWNGWATPWFEYGEAIKLVDCYNQLDWQPAKKAWYDIMTDQFCFIPDGETEPECYSAETIDAEGLKVKAYPIGTQVWIWEQVD